MQTRLVALGVVGRPHGLRGEVRVHPYNADSELFGSLPEFSLFVSGKAVSARVRSARRANGVWLFAFENFPTRQDVEALRGVELSAPRSAFPPLPEGEFYQTDLEGLIAEATDGSRIGTIARVLEYPASLVLEVQTEDGTREVPMIPPYLVRIELDRGRVVVDHIDELDPVRGG